MHAPALPDAVMYQLAQIPGSVIGTAEAPAGYAPYPEHSKSQWIRLADIAVIGPGMIFAALQMKPPAWVRTGLLVAGLGTVLYNLNNFLRIQRETAAMYQPQMGQLPGELPAQQQSLTREQWSLIASLAIAGPWAIYSGLGMTPPAWLRAGMFVTGVGTVILGLNQLQRWRGETQA
jgi:hypothetical protein